ncbi:rhodanese-like domain-containing protein [Geoalkalibacter halelectricus]|uniref:Rhodanese-like domain-containing protein n=1 Tax=Geoalkalibacter halelectricus TaxID=2847045 RepID=A0ABY5ZLI2_9BACT|nr:rhodanese-like domain-containing protein [Geoalkalibacter halelectricus]MDO3378662.1 rhodanese-like domain-containing protein [Geoalkalibacter halelectricus]UWZ80027.1 rhodanese-like domain-containing protein [Geoalkalibacter halelectricus]
MRRIMLCTLLFALLAWSGPVAAVEDPPEISAADLKTLMDKGEALVVFPLSLIEFNSLHIAGSVHIELGQIPAALPADKNQTLVFYCLGRT